MLDKQRIEEVIILALRDHPEAIQLSIERNISPHEFAMEIADRALGIESPNAKELTERLASGEFDYIFAGAMGYT